MQMCCEARKLKFKRKRQQASRYTFYLENGSFFTLAEDCEFLRLARCSNSSMTWRQSPQEVGGLSTVVESVLARMAIAFT